MESIKAMDFRASSVASAEKPRAGSGEPSGSKISSPGEHDSVTISGRANLLSRVYGRTEEDYSAVVAKRGTSFALGDYLTADDRRLMEKLYQYAASNDIDLSHVDALAQDLGAYRAYGKSNPIEGLYDTSGRRLTVNFSSQEAEVAKRIQSSSAKDQSGFDMGFVESAMVVGGHATNFVFLEHMINAFGGNSEKNNMAIGKYDKSQTELVATASEKVELVIPEADYVSENGVGTWRNPSEKEPKALSTGLYGTSTPFIAQMLENLGRQGGMAEYHIQQMLQLLRR